MKRHYVTIKLSLNNLYVIIFSLNDNKRLSDRLYEIASKKEEEIRNKKEKEKVVN